MHTRSNHARHQQRIVGAQQLQGDQGTEEGMKNVLIGLAILIYRIIRAAVLLPLCFVLVITLWPFVTLYDLGKERKWND